MSIAKHRALLGRYVPKSWLRDEACVVAPRLLGCTLVSQLPGETITAGIIVEVEAYDVQEPACHGYGGKTERNQALFGPCGRAYVYRSYGLHWCFNVVTGLGGHGAAVLVRALEPVYGLETMVRRRHKSTHKTPLTTVSPLLCRGPGNVADALGITRDLDEQPVIGRHASLTLLTPQDMWRSVSVSQSPRIGITKATDLPWRFFVTSNRYVSATRRATPWDQNAKGGLLQGPS